MATKEFEAKNFLSLVRETRDALRREAPIHTCYADFDEISAISMHTSSDVLRERCEQFLVRTDPRRAIVDYDATVG